MHIVLLCATQRGYRFLKRLTELMPQSQLTVFSFREDPWEPPFLDHLHELTVASKGRFVEARQVGDSRLNEFWETSAIDIMFLVNWRYKVSPTIYKRPRLGTFVFHDALLPAYRGFSPTVWAMINGEEHTGVTLFEISEDIDTGRIVDQKRIPIGPDDTIADVTDRVTQTYLSLLERNLEKLLDGSAPRIAQDHALATYTCKRLPEDNVINWTASSASIYNLIRAVSPPYPGAYTFLAGTKLYVLAAQRLADYPKYVGAIPGRVVEVRPGLGTVVLTGDGALLLTQVKLDGQEVTCAADVLNRVTHTLGR